jgi:hypothetical protein
MTNPLAPLALPLGAALLLAGSALAQSPLEPFARRVTATLCHPEVQAALVGRDAFTRGQAAAVTRQALADEAGLRLSSSEMGLIDGMVRVLSKGGYCEPGRI